MITGYEVYLIVQEYDEEIQRETFLFIYLEYELC